MYIRFEQDIKTHRSNLFISNQAFENIYKPLVSTSLGHSPQGDIHHGENILEGQEAGSIATNQLLKIRRRKKQERDQELQQKNIEAQAKARAKAKAGQG